MNGTEIIGTNAFCGCDDLTSVTLPDTIESIGIAAFDDCDNITVYYKGNVYEKNNFFKAMEWMDIILAAGVASRGEYLSGW